MMFLFSSLATSPHKKWWVLFAMSVSLGMTFIDQTAIALALPKMQRVFNLSPVATQWIVNSYLLSQAAFLIIGGRLGDIFQHHKIFTIGILIFLFSSIACALAQNFVWLIGSRAIQGFGASLMLPNSAVIVINTFSPTEKGKAMGIYVGSALLFTPIALIIGGLFTEFLSWRLIFWINLPLCLLCLLIVSQIIKSDPAYKAEHTKVDWLGGLMLIAGVVTLVTALMESTQLGWDSLLIQLLLGSSVICFIIFYYLEKMGRSIIDFSVFKNKIFSFATLIFFVMSIGLGFFVFDAIFYQTVLGFSPALSGILFFPNMICIVSGAMIAGRSLDRYGYKKPVIFGLSLMIIGLFLKAALLPLQNFFYLLLPIALLNFGGPFIMSPINTTALSSVEQNKRGSASGILNAIKQISGSITLALLTLIIIRIYNYFLTNFIELHKKIHPGLTISKLNALLNSQETPVDGIENLTGLLTVARDNFAISYSIAQLIFGFVFCGIFLVTLLFFKSQASKESHQQD